MEAPHGDSSRIPFILDLFFKFSFEVKIRQAILQNNHGAQNMFCFVESKHSSSCILKCNSFYLIIWGGVMSFLKIWVRVSWFTCCREWDILNPPISSLELSCVMFHLMLSLGIVAIYGSYKWPKFFIYPPGEISFSSPCWYQSNLLFSLVAEFHVIVLRCSP